MPPPRVHADLLARVRALAGPDTPSPLSEEAVRAAEALLGFALPPLLRDLYRAVGNGGFGPGYGLLPLGGDRDLSSPDAYDNLDDDHAVVRYARFDRHAPVLVLNGQIAERWPSGMLPFCDWGCGIYSCVWCEVPDAPVYVYDWNVPETMALLRHTDALDEWLTRWADGVDLWSEMRRLEPDWSEPEPSEW